ncbi:MAG: VOC family protein [Candidatus Sungbacteria bacterium]|nr:VOC family protein [Candidatus Sungbacteria bacterium]
MLNLNSIMVGSEQPKILAEFYEKVLGKPTDMTEGEWYGWQAGGAFFGIGKHSEVSGRAKEPARIILNFETAEVGSEFERIKAFGAAVVKEPYEMEGVWIATFADPDGNYFQLMSPWSSK